MRWVPIILGVAAAALAVTSADQAFAGKRTLLAGSVPQATYIKVGALTSIPYGWLDFCNRNAQECRGGLSQAVDIVLTAETWRTLGDINVKVNDMITPLSDMRHWGVTDRWDLPDDGYGDCEDYVLLKRKLLIAAGLPRQALLVTVVKDEKGEGHAVLTVKTDRGDFVLDNMRDKVRAWSDLPYRFVKRQTQTDPNVWEQIGEPTTAPLTVAR